ncbi:MAG: hypothetical protein Q8O40_11420 [Chloroflexota bacterium]|nr:hypothetical protein [Chloroflexota bacterium]
MAQLPGGITGSNCNQVTQQRGCPLNIFVGNLSREVSEADLRSLFTHYGSVTTITVVVDPLPPFHTTRGTSQYSLREAHGYAYIEMPDKTEAFAAVQGMDGAYITGRAVRVIEALPMDKRKTASTLRQTPLGVRVSQS